LFVVPAVVIFIALWTRASKDKWLIPAVIRNVVFVSGVVGSKFLFGYLLAGERALSLFGMYGTVESIAQGAASIAASSITNEVAGNVFFTSWGQTLMIVMILGLSLPVAIHGVILGFSKKKELFEQIKFRALFGIALPNMMVAIASFEALINSDVWMHTRYYSYLIPLAILVLLEGIRSDHGRNWPFAKSAVAAVFIGLSTYNLFTLAAPYSSNWIDAPDFKEHIDSPLLSQFALVVGIAAAVIWLWRSRVALVVGLFLSIFLSIFVGAANSEHLRATFGEDTAYEHVARVLRDFVPQDELDRAVLAGQNEGSQRIVFSSMTGGVTIFGDVDSVLDRKDLANSKSWLIAIGEPMLVGFGEPVIKGLGYNMYSLDSRNLLQPRNNRVSEFSNPCLSAISAGWACGDEVAIKLEGPFPPRANVDLIFELTADAAESDIELVLGGAVISGKLSAGINALNVKFSNSTSEDSLVVRFAPGENQNNFQSERFLRPIWGLAKTTG